MSPPSSPRQVLLGFFILFQLAFLVVSNLLGFLKWSNSEATAESAQIVNRLAPGFGSEKGHGWQWCDDLETHVLRPWTQFSLQDQSWSLFAPDAGKTTGFLAVLLLGDDEPGLGGAIQVFDPVNGHHFVADWKSPRHGQSTMMLSDNEPSDVHKFFRFGKFRLRRYEGILFTFPLPRENESAADHAERLTGRLAKLVRNYQAMMLAFTRWQLKSWQQANPDLPLPKQVILCQRLYRIHGPDEPHGWDGPFIVPMARWRPRPGQADADVVLDSYDFTQQRFSPVK